MKRSSTILRSLTKGMLMRSAAEYLFLWVIGVFCFMGLAGCAELQDQREHGSITSAGFTEANARMENIDMVYVRNWLKSHGTTPEGLIGKTSDEVQKILGRPSEKLTHEVMCRYNPQRAKARALNPGGKSLNDEYDRYWCKEDHQQWRFNIARWFFLMGNTYCQITFENGRVSGVGNLLSSF